MTREEAWKPIVSEERYYLDSSLSTKLIQEIYGSRYQFLAEDALARIADANFYYDFYDLKGQYWSMPNKLGYTPTIMPVNLARWFVNKRVSWLFEVAPDVECPPETVDDPEDMQSIDYEPSRRQRRLDSQAADRENIIYTIWGENRFEEALLSGGKDYFIGGTVALKLRYLPGKGLRLQFCPVQEIFPIPDEDEPDKFQKIHFASFFDNQNTIWRQTWELINGRCYLTEGLYDIRNLEPIEMRYQNEDTLLDFIPVIIFPRQALSGEIFGHSYLRDLITLMEQYNRSLSDAADSLRFNLFAITVMLNAPPDAEKQVKLSPQEIWNIGGEGVDVKKLESGFNYAGALSDFLTRLENIMHLVGDVPDITPDRIKGFGLVSGVALKLLYSDLVSATQQEWRIWKSRIVQANEYILKMLEVYSKSDPDFPYSNLPISSIANKYTNRVIPHLPLPENEAEKIQMEVDKLRNSMQSVKGALQELGEKFPERKIAEILAEREKFFSASSTGKEIEPPESKEMAGL